MESILKRNDSLSMQPLLNPRDVKKTRYLIEDTETNQFFRIGRREYLLLSAFNGRRTLPEAVQAAYSSAPDLEWSETFAAKCCDWLQRSSLLVPTSVAPSESNAQNRSIAERAAPSLSDSSQDRSSPATAPNNAESTAPIEPVASESRDSENANPSAKSFDPLSFKLDLLSGERLRAWLAPLRPLYGVWLAVAVIALIAGGMLTFASNYEFVVDQGQRMLVPESAFWWLLAWFITKAIHELGHAFVAVCKSGNVRGAGITFFCFAPIPFVDVSDIWRTEKTRDRVLCTGSGMIAEIVLSCIALMICCFSSSSILQYACIAIASMGTISTLAFNANPLMRFDGYYLLCDVLGRPNLWTAAQGAFTSRLRVALFSEGQPLGSIALAVYGLGTYLYRIVLLGSLAWGAIYVWEGVGVVICAFGAYSWVFRPWWAKRNLSKSNPQAPSISSPARRVPRLSIVAMAMVALVLFGWNLPAPWQRFSPGIVAYSKPESLRAVVDGKLLRFHVRDGQRVREGQLIAELSNDDLQRHVAEQKLEIEMTDQQMHSAYAAHELAELQTLTAKKKSLEKELRLMSTKNDALKIVATRDGVFRSQYPDRAIGFHVAQGDAIGEIVDPDNLEIKLSIEQSDIHRYIGRSATEINSHHQLTKETPSDLIPVDEPRFIAVNFSNGNRIESPLATIEPRASTELLSPVLSGHYGGPLPVMMVDSEEGAEPKTEQARFTVKVYVPTEHAADLAVGQPCLAFPVGSSETLGQSVRTISTRAFEYFFTTAEN